MPRPNRRTFLQTTTAAAATTLAGGYFTSAVAAPARAGFASANEQPNVGFIGTGIRFHTYLGDEAIKYGPCPAVCDVDSVQAGRALQVVYDKHREHKFPLTTRVDEDYRALLDRKDIDCVVIGSVDHWHSKLAIDAMRAGKDVYCEKPLTLTIREGQQILKVLGETKAVFQVGTQQRSEFGMHFVKAAQMIREDRVGKLDRVTVCIGGSRDCDPLPIVEPPSSLNWDMWQGQCPSVPYRQADTIVDDKGWGAGHPFGRAHRYYRWFYEYSGGKLTDWGAHHVDIAMWAMNKLGDDAGILTVDPQSVTHPVPFDEAGYPTIDDRFNCATKFNVLCTFEDGIEMMVTDNADDLGFDNGVMFSGSDGRFLVNRGKLVGKPVEMLKENPLDESAMGDLYVSGKVPKGPGKGNTGAQMQTFMECIKTRETPNSDVASHHKMMNVCHAINIAMRLGRKLKFDTKNEKFIDDEAANGFIERQQRAGYEIDV